MFPGVKAAVARLPARTALIDGEVAVPLPDGRTSFQALQNALSRSGAGTVYYAFDLLHLDGRDLTGEPLETRKQALQELVAGAPGGTAVFFSGHVAGNGSRFFDQARERGLEGIVSKRRREPYRSGRSLSWLKTKCVSRQEFVIGGFTEPEGAREALGALLIGYYDRAGKLMFAGKVGTGFSQKVLRDLRKRLGLLQQSACPFAVPPPPAFVGRTAHWVRPELVGEVNFIEWTHDGRLRHPSFQGLRADKPARDVVREAPSAPTAEADEPSADAEAAEELQLPAAAAAAADAAGDPPATEDRRHAAARARPVSSKRRTSTAGATRKRARGDGGAAPATRKRAHGAADDSAGASGKAPAGRDKPAAAARKHGSNGSNGAAHPGAGKGAAARAPAASASIARQKLKAGEVEVLGQRLSNPDRVYYPDAGLTKLDLARFYEQVGEAMLPHVGARPLSLVRCPEGLPGGCFYVKHMKLNTSPVLAQIPIRESQKMAQYLVVDSVPGLVALAQMGMLEIHIWNSTRDHLEQPDRFVMDLDPGPEVPWSETMEAARLCRATLKKVGLESFVKTTGGKGLHVVVPIVPDLDWDSVLALSRGIAELIVRQGPQQYTTDMAKKGRERKILIDYLRNIRGATSVCAFSTRARPGATVSVPLAWDELDDDLRPDAFTIKTVPDRLRAQRQDPWKRYFSIEQAVPRDLAKLLVPKPQT
jgi:bifunctional non-homologous end joining protein LigD